MESISALLAAASPKIPFLLRFGIPVLLIGCVVIGATTLIVLVKQSVAQKREKAIVDAAADTDENAPTDIE